MYVLKFDEYALKQIEKLPFEIRKRIFSKLQKIKQNPFHFCERLVDSLSYKLRVGDYRVIVDLDQSTKCISVLYVGHRKSIYRGK